MADELKMAAKDRKPDRDVHTPPSTHSTTPILESRQTQESQIQEKVHTLPNTNCPLQPGWQVSFYNNDLVFITKTVKNAKLEHGRWVVTLDSDKEIYASIIRVVTKIQDGVWGGSWMVRNHGLDGSSTPMF